MNVPPRRTTRLAHLAGTIGDNILRVEDAATGWPSRCLVRTDGGDVAVALHIGTVIKTHRGRDEIERRIENPGQERPVQAPAGTLPLIVGIWEERETPVLVAFDARRRIATDTRQSMFVKLSQLEQAVAVGWAEDTSTSGEAIYAFTPTMLPAYVEMLRNGVEIPAIGVSNVIAAAGLTASTQNSTAAERARRAMTALVRNASFGRRVVDAFDGLCALCGIDSGLVEGAHVYPAEAPGSSDEIWNGIALCANHHTAFDRHLLWISPESRAVRVHDQLQRAAVENDACGRFLAGTFDVARASSAGPHPEMFKRRYGFYEGRYGWAEETS